MVGRPKTREYPHPARTALVELRKKKFKGMYAYRFAEMLGVTRLHMTAVEVGRKAPSLELALRWMEVLGPEAKFSMFQPIATMADRPATMRYLRKISPDLYNAA